MIITSEHFHSRLQTTEELSRLRTILVRSFDSIEILCYFREQSRLARSAYSTHLLGGGTTSFEAYLKRATPENFYYNHETLATLWSDVFVGARFTARVFEPRHLVNGDIIEDFAARVFGPGSHAPQTVVSPPPLNIGLGPVGARAMLLLNAWLPARGDDGVVRPGREPLHALVHRAGFLHQGSTAFPEAPQVYAAFHDSNVRFAERFLGLSGNPFRPPDPVPRVTADPIPPGDFLAFLEQLTLLGVDLQAARGERAGRRSADMLRLAAARIEGGEMLGLSDARDLLALAAILRPADERIHRRLMRLERRILRTRRIGEAPA